MIRLKILYWMILIEASEISDGGKENMVFVASIHGLRKVVPKRWFLLYAMIPGKFVYMTVLYHHYLLFRIHFTNLGLG